VTRLKREGAIKFKVAGATLKYLSKGIEELIEMRMRIKKIRPAEPC
jgi:hypothetical protein